MRGWRNAQHRGLKLRLAQRVSTKGGFSSVFFSKALSLFLASEGLLGGQYWGHLPKSPKRAKSTGLDSTV